MELEMIRKQIDAIDTKIRKLFNDRMEQALLAGKCKTRVEDRQREAEIFEKLGNNPYTLLDGDFLTELYEKILAKSKEWQSRSPLLIAFQGEHGAYSEVAARSWNPKCVSLPCKEFSDVFEGVKKGVYDFGIVPVENNLGGIVSQVNDLMIHTELYVVGAIEIPVKHCLVACPQTDYREIREVYSHAQALAQCRNFLSRNHLLPVPFYDTAGAAKMLSEKGATNAAAISSELAAQLYGLQVIKESIEDFASNRTRFLVLSNQQNPEPGSKCSAVFSTEHKSGTLFAVLQQYAQAGLNLTRIESIPNQKGSYAFFLDFLGSIEDPAVQNVVEISKQITTGFRVLGCYEEKVL
ncbi:MAG TPA: bifunctional chorismate mutase/prephenate dehydratase [Thermotogota bacterium]|nr:bifunctional chorismate mutase/prephenate dehydratase [Thermotogota bacterium]